MYRDCYGYFSFLSYNIPVFTLTKPLEYIIVHSHTVDLFLLTDIIIIIYIKSLSGVDYRCCSQFGQGVSPIHIYDLDCSGSEYRISSCQYNGNNTLDFEDYESDIWSVYCYIG